MRVSRRGVVAGAGAVVLAGCGGTVAPRARAVTRHAYGDLPDQYGELHLPSGEPRASVVLLHGGYWQAPYGLDLMDPMARRLAHDGWAAWNLEYRRVGEGGGWPATLEDVAAGVDRVASLPGLDAARVVLVGHSAGGQLAVWAASRTAATPGGAPAVRPRGVVSLAGVLDLTHAERADLGAGAVDQLLGGAPSVVPARYARADPVALVPAPCPVACVHGDHDQVVPTAQSTAYVEADRAAGGTATYDEVAHGDHFTVIDPRAPSWEVVVRRLTRLAGA